MIYRRVNNQFRMFMRDAVAGTLALILVLLAALLLFDASSVVAGAVRSDPRNDVPPTILPTPESVNPTTNEASALYDLARELDWPTTVWRDFSGRLYIEDVVSNDDWARAIIRPFDFPAGAEAAFLAEQEDARIAGYEVTATTFHGFTAYWARLENSSGQIVGRRLHWLVESWILGAEVAGANRGDGEVVETSEAHYLISGQYGITLRPTATPSPTVAPPHATSTSTGTGTPTAPARTPTRPPASTPRPSSTSTPCPTFSDVPTSHWAYTYIRGIACRGIVSGYADGTFRPQSQVTRGQLVKIIVLSEGFPLADPATPTFADVGRGNIFYRYIETASARRIITGYSDKTFRPYDNVKRAQIAKIITLAKRWPLVRPTSDPACDVPKSHWAANYIYTAMTRDALTGYANGCFDPDAYATRAQIAKTLVAARP